MTYMKALRNHNKLKYTIESQQEDLALWEEKVEDAEARLANRLAKAKEANDEADEIESWLRNMGRTLADLKR